MVVGIVLGGSTNAVLHLIAMARAASVEADASTISTRSANERPAARRFQTARQVRDGRPAQSRRRAGGDEDAAREGHARRRSCMTVTGKTIAENLQDARRPGDGQNDHRTRSTSRSRRPATFSILHGNLAPDGAVAQDHRQGRPASSKALRASSIPKKTCCTPSRTRRSSNGDVIVIRYEGPKGGPGMPEMLTPTSRLWPAPVCINTSR